jgi:hypothetical protein
MTRHQVGQSTFSWLKFFIILLGIASIVGAIIIGYLAFTHQLPPIVGAVSFIVIVGLFIWFITILRKSSMHYRSPSFILVFLSLLGITLVCAFAGVEPLASYKDMAVNGTKTFLSQYTTGGSTTSPSIPKSSVVSPLNGTYTGIILGLEQTATFNGNTVTFYNDGDGKRIYEYFISAGLESGQVINLKNVATGKTRTETFKYNAQYDICTIEGINYYR